jgi:phosphatidylserine/phosphatidylglycerophosphate/cardiolipin synthase-like enzyme
VNLAAARVLAVALGLAAAANAPAAAPMPARGSLQVAFSPGDDVGALIVEAIAGARQQILVQAFSFTHKSIAEALIAALRRGVDVQVIADHEQTYAVQTSLISLLVASGMPVWLDGEHAAAHNKVMIIDVGLPGSTVVTGSFNFTHAGQYRNAENLLILRGNATLAEAYAANWRRHRLHSQPARR